MQTYNDFDDFVKKKQENQRIDPWEDWKFLLIQGIPRGLEELEYVKR